MTTIQNQTFDQERALYGRQELLVRDCAFDGPADGESAFKECSDIQTEHCFFNLRYPFWHDRNLTIEDCEMTPLCRAALWYCDNGTWRQCTVWYCNAGSWIQCVPYYNSGGSWIRV